MNNYKTQFLAGKLTLENLTQNPKHIARLKSILDVQASFFAETNKKVTFNNESNTILAGLGIESEKTISIQEFIEWHDEPKEMSAAQLFSEYRILVK